MIVAVLIALTLAFSVLVVHCHVNRWLIDKRHGCGSALALAGVCLLLVSLHLVEIALFAAGYELAGALGAGGFERPAEVRFMDVYYFSLASYATLGLGKVMPTGHLAFIAGVEAIAGFLCITLSASTIFQAMQRRTD